MVSLNPSTAALTSFDSGYLLGLSVKLLDLPTDGTHLLCVVGGVSVELIGDDVVRAAGRNRKPE